MTEYFERNGERFIRTTTEIKLSDVGLPFPIPPIVPPVVEPPGKLKIAHSVVNGAVKLEGVGFDNLVLVDNDFFRDSPENPLLWLMFDKGKINLAAYVVTNNPDPNWTIDVMRKHYTDDRDWAVRLGMKIPEPVIGSTKPLVRPSNGNIDSTIISDGPGVDAIIAAAHKCTPAKPLIVLVGGQCTSVASAYLKDKTIAPKMVVFHTEGWWKSVQGSYNLADPWSAEICVDRLKYVNPISSAHAWWIDKKTNTMKPLGLTKIMVDSIPDGNPAVKIFKRWFTENFPKEGMADAAPFLWLLDNSLWKSVQRRKKDGTTTGGDDYDFLFIPDHDWAKYGPVLVNKFKELLSGAPPVVIPPVVTPPIGGIERDIEVTIERAAPGSIVKLAAGKTFPIRVTNVPPLVSIEGDNTTLVATVSGSESSGQKVGVLNYNSSAKTNGNQKIAGCLLDGKNIGYSGLMISNRDNIIIENVKVKDFNFNGIWISNSTGSEVKGNDFYNTGWSDSRYLSGALNIYQVENLTIDGNTFRSDKNNKGTGIEALWKQSTLKNLKIINNKFALSHQNPWNNGTSKNFSIELHDTYYRGMEIAYNDFGNEMSLASHKSGDGSKTLIHHNTGNLGGDTYFVELVGNDFEIYDNVVSNAQMFAANFQANSVWKNWLIRNNQLLNSPGVPSWGAAVLVGPLGVQNVRIENNKFPGPVLKYMGVQGGVTLIGTNQ